MGDDLGARHALSSLDEVMWTMTERRIRHLPVVDGGRLVGFVSIGGRVEAQSAPICTEFPHVVPLS